MAYGKIKADTLVWDNSGSDVETTVQSLTTPAPEGTVIKSTGESGGTKFLREDGDNTCSWQAIPVPTSITVADESTDTICNILYTTAAAGNLAPKTGSNITFNSNTGLLSTTAVTTTGDVIVGGNLTVSGTTTTVNSTTLTVDDKNIELGSVSSPSDTTADGGGITLKGASDKTFNWVDATDAWTSSEHINVGDNKKLLVGTGSDLGIYHDGSASYLKNTTGNLVISDTDGDIHIQAKDGEHSIIAHADGSVKLYHNDSAKLETTAAGVTVTGTVSDSLGNVRSIKIAEKTSAYVLVADDAGRAIHITTGGVTVNASVFSGNEAVTIINNSGSDQTITQGSGFTLHNSADASSGNRTLAGRGMCTIYFASSTVGYISGAGLS